MTPHEAIEENLHDLLEAGLLSQEEYDAVFSPPTDNPPEE